MKLRPIKTEENYRHVLKRLEKIFDAEKGTREGDELEVIGLLIEKHEEENFPIDLPDPVKAIKFRMKQLGMTRMI